MTSQKWRHRHKNSSISPQLNSLQNVYFQIFIVWKLTELCRFVTYLWNDPRSLQPQYVYLPDLITKSMNWIEIRINALDKIVHRKCLALLHCKDPIVQFCTCTNPKCILHIKIQITLAIFTMHPNLECTQTETHAVTKWLLDCVIQTQTQIWKLCLKENNSRQRSRQAQTYKYHIISHHKHICKAP